MVERSVHIGEVVGSIPTRRTMIDSKKFLTIAIREAENSMKLGSGPIGAVIVDKKGKILAKGFNRTKIENDPTAHAEVVCMRKASKFILERFHSEETYLFTTLEPCFACGFFLVRTNIRNVVWALNDPYYGGMSHLKKSKKLSNDFKKIKCIEEPFTDLREQSRVLMHLYYKNKKDFKTAKLFT